MSEYRVCAVQVSAHWALFLSCVFYETLFDLWLVFFLLTKASHNLFLTLLQLKGVKRFHRVLRLNCAKKKKRINCEAVVVEGVIKKKKKEPGSSGHKRTSHGFPQVCLTVQPITHSPISSIGIDSGCYLEWSCPSAFGRASPSQSISPIVSVITGTILCVGIVVEAAVLFPTK